MQIVSNSDWDKCPQRVRQGLFNYIEYRIPPGGFLTAVLSNKLFEAMGRADDINCGQLFAIVSWIYNYAPSNCHGSKEAVEAWLANNNKEV